MRENIRAAYHAAFITLILIGGVASVLVGAIKALS